MIGQYSILINLPAPSCEERQITKPHWHSSSSLIQLKTVVKELN